MVFFQYNLSTGPDFCVMSGNGLCTFGSPAGRSHVYKEVKLDGSIVDVIAGMREFAQKQGVVSWGLRAIMDFVKSAGERQ